MLFFTADLHLGSDEILTRERRPFKTMNDFENFIIKIWNKQASSNDMIYVIGDFFNYNSKCTNGWESALPILNKLQCPVTLILGNNEQRIIDRVFNGDFVVFKKYCIEHGFSDVVPDAYLSFHDENFYLNHFPRNHRDGFVNLFGHTHRVTGLWKPFGLNVGCDLQHFYLLDEDEVIRLLYYERNYWYKDVDNLCMS